MARFQTPKGTRDFLPAEMLRRQRIINTVREAYELFGFQPLETPVFESWELLSAKGGGGEAVKNEIYYFRDKGDRELGLKFDLTVPLARVIANNPQLPKPFKRYQIQPVWRYDNPQAGRYREFWQADVDIAGAIGMEAEAELIAAAVEVLKRLGIGEYSIKISNRKILNGIVEMVGVKDSANVFRVLDKIEKAGRKETENQLKIIMKEAYAKKLLDLISVKGSPARVLSEAKKKFKGIKIAEEGISELERVVSLVSPYGIKSNIEVDFSLVRGLDYYTGPIFEISVQSEKSPGSVCGGGRYDGLVELYGGTPTPCAGFSFGVDRLYNLLEAEGNLELPKTKTQVFVVSIGENAKNEAAKIAARLRQGGINTETDLMGRNVRKQLDYINSMQIPLTLFVGEKEIQEDKLTLREMGSGAERKVYSEDIAEEIKKIIDGDDKC